MGILNRQSTTHEAIHGEIAPRVDSKDAVAQEIEENVRRRAGGPRGYPNLISRHEDSAAMRSQAKTDKLLSDNPVLMRLRELEVLEEIAVNGKLSIVLGEKNPGEKGLADKVINLL